MRAKTTYLVVAIALASCGVAYAALSDGHHGRSADPAPASQLRVSGHVTGLFPGARKGIRVDVRNGSRRWAVLRAVRADVRAGDSGCSPDHLSTKPKDLSYPRIRPHKTRHVRIPIRMWQGAPNACQRAEFPLLFKVRAGR